MGYRTYPDMGNTFGPGRISERFKYPSLQTEGPYMRLTSESLLRALSLVSFNSAQVFRPVQ
jgi:hypothetical protein